MIRCMNIGMDLFVEQLESETNWLLQEYKIDQDSVIGVVQSKTGEFILVFKDGNTWVPPD